MTRSNHRRAWWLTTLLALIALAAAGLIAACGDDDDEPAPTASPSAPATDASPSATAAGTASPAAPTATPTQAPVEGEIVVFAASSLTDAFKEAATKFQEKNPRARVTFSNAASSALATQINEGAPADVFASADTAQMKVVTDKGNASDPVIFATNLPTVVVPKSSTAVQSFADLAKPGVRLVLAGPEVPIGNYARQILANASKSDGAGVDFADKVLANLKSNEANVRAVLTKVQLGEADAGIVYTTDAAIAANDVRLIEIPTQVNIIAQYPTAVLKGAKNPAGAKAWVDFITGPDGQAVLAKYGFGKPPARTTALPTIGSSPMIAAAGLMGIAPLHAPGAWGRDLVRAGVR